MLGEVLAIVRAFSGGTGSAICGLRLQVPFVNPLECKPIFPGGTLRDSSMTGRSNSRYSRCDSPSGLTKGSVELSISQAPWCFSPLVKIRTRVTPIVVRSLRSQRHGGQACNAATVTSAAQRNARVASMPRPSRRKFITKIVAGESFRRETPSRPPNEAHYEEALREDLMFIPEHPRPDRGKSGHHRHPDPPITRIVRSDPTHSDDQEQCAAAC